MIIVVIVRGVVGWVGKWLAPPKEIDPDKPKKPPEAQITYYRSEQ